MSTLLAMTGLWVGHGSAEAQTIDDHHANAGFSMFADSMDTTIWSPRVSAGTTIFGVWEMDANWTADVITSASVDVITAATASISETRHALALSGRRESLLKDLDASAGYSFSIERDYTSHTGIVGASRGLWQDNTELALTYGITLNQIGTSGTPKSTWRDSTIHNVESTWTQVLGKRTVFALVGSMMYADGYQANPYRQVPVLMSPTLIGATWVPERVPDQRMRLGITPQLRRALGEQIIVSAAYRLYGDDWGVMSHTFTGDAVWTLPGDLALRIHTRASWQGRADFYQEAYMSELEYRTRDRRLGEHFSGVAGAMALWNASLPGIGDLDLHLGFDAMAWQYNEFLAPTLTTTFGAGLETLGWVRGAIIQFGAEVKIQ